MTNDNIQKINALCAAAEDVVLSWGKGGDESLEELGNHIALLCDTLENIPTVYVTTTDTPAINVYSEDYIRVSCVQPEPRNA